MIAALIMAHKNFDQVKRLVNSLKNERVDIYLHVDKKADFVENEFSDIRVVDERFDVYWGDSSFVEATMYSLKYALSNGDYSHFIMMSGQDYLVKPISKICDFLEVNKNVNYITCGKVEDKNTKNRYLRYRFRNNLLDKISVKFFRRKNIFEDMIVCWGSNWWILTKDAVEYVLQEYNDKYCEKIHFTSCMDELLIQTILYNSSFKSLIAYDIKYYIDWSSHIMGNDKGNPNILTKEDYDKIIKSGAFFCRKVDANVDPVLLDLLDKYRG